MFINFQKVEQAAHHTDGLQNPKNPGNPMALGIYRNKIGSIIYRIHTKKAYGEYWDTVENKKIARRLWTPEMKAFCEQKIAEAPKPPYFFKMTVVGWIFVLGIVAFFAYLTYDSVKPEEPKPAAFVAMEQAPAVGDVYFGSSELYKKKGDPVGVKVNFGWFKVVGVEGDTYRLAPSIEQVKNHQPKETLNNTEFASEALPAVKIKEQTSYNIRFVSEDGLTTVYITDKN